MKLEETYKILVDFVSKHQFERIQHFNNINLAVQTLVASAIGLLIFNSPDKWHFSNIFLIVPVLGIVFSGFWIVGLKVIRNDIDLRWAQIRAQERIMRETGVIRPEQEIFLEGKRYYEGQGTLEELRTPNMINKSFLQLGYVLLFQSLAAVLGLMYVFLIVLQLC
jgi:hypothetical protein